MSKDHCESASDEVLLQKARSGNRDAFVQFARRFWPIVGRVAWSMVGDVSQALRATEEVLGIALHSSQRPEIPVRLWIYRLAIWLAIVRRRSGRSAARPETPLFEALGGLDCKDRAALVLCDVEGVAVADAGAILEASPAEIRKHAHRARIHLARVLGADAIDLEMNSLERLSA